jgi:Fe-S cluster biosynthesis and repair protein YggX
MTRLVQCIKLQKELPGLDAPPYPGELGERIYQQVSAIAWQQWLQQQTMFINEYRLSLRDPEARAMLKYEMEKFFFLEGSAPPSGYVPPEAKGT